MKSLIYTGGKIRIDKYFKEEIFVTADVARADVIAAVKSGQILVNGKKVKPSYLLKNGDEIGYADVISNEPILEANDGSDIPLIFENADFLVFNKPAGVQVHPDEKNQNDTLVNYVVAAYPEVREVHDQSKDAKLRPGIVHRLDKDTSGVIVVARNMETYVELKRQFQDREITKKYFAIVHGVPEPAEGVIEKPLARSSDYRKQVVAGLKTKTKIRPAVTNYRLIERYGTAYALVEAIPKTGRMHQIRVHLTSIGHPIVGDKKYLL